MADISMAQLVEQLLEAFVERQNHDLVNGPTQEPGSSQHPWSQHPWFVASGLPWRHWSFVSARVCV